MEFVALDFETTGYEHGETNEPWQLGIVLVRDFEIVEMKEFFFDHDFRERFEEWSPYLTGRRLVAHNIACERTILTKTAPLTKWGPWVDTMKLAKARFPKLPSYTLGDLCTAFGCVPELPPRTWHDALYDALACAYLSARLAGSTCLPIVR